LLQDINNEAIAMARILEPRGGAYRDWLLLLQRYAATQLEQAQVKK
jgi:hypothetical protein